MTTVCCINAMIFCEPLCCDFWFVWPFRFLLCWPSCAYSRLALDDAIRHKQLNISSRFSSRVAGENDFLQTVINKVITAKEINHKGQGKLQNNNIMLLLKCLPLKHNNGFQQLYKYCINFCTKIWHMTFS